ncbi:MAG: 2-amino-4-hydroxy-6-hydroxymethyldihydropteridine diphosphokinase [Acidobacteria bacterium]|nr:2-amino-4-hydroxy-6-hydroxymethyldihydropteridine diphosphokinase [Acidobacteriota bacterium]
MRDERVYLGLGSNVGNRIAHLRAGLAGLRERGLRLRAVSSFYLTEPDLRPGNPTEADLRPSSEEPTELEETDHPWYVNCVAAVVDAPAADQLLDLCLAVEEEHGYRRRPTSEDCGPPQPRMLDVDVLMIGERIIEDSSIRVPHPWMQDRRFVLVPFAEIAPRARHPVAGATIGDMLTALPERERVWLLAPPPSEVG